MLLYVLLSQLYASFQQCFLNPISTYTQGPLVSANLVEIAIEFNRSDGAIARSLGSALVLALAFATVTWSVISVKFGKRPVFLVCTLLMFAGSMISGFSE